MLSILQSRLFFEKKYLLFVLLCFTIFTSNALAQMTVEDKDSNILMEISDEGTVGSIVLPDTIAAPVNTENKLYNLGGTLNWNGSQLLLGGSSGWTVTENNVYSVVSGNVGIGTIAPEAPLHIVTNSQYDPGNYGDQRKGSLLLTLSGATQGNGKYGPAVAFSGINTGRRRAAIVSMQTSEDHDQVGLAFFTSPSTYTTHDAIVQQMVITHDGNVGIGTMSPYAKLEVVGHVKTTSISSHGDIQAYDGGEIAVMDAFGAPIISMSPSGLLAKGSGLNPAAKFWGKIEICNFGGVPVVEIGEGLDYAEGFDISNEDEVAAGTVLIIDTDNPGKLTFSTKPYDSRVAGIVAGASSLGSGIILGSGEFDSNVALAGRVYCNVDASKSVIKAGDLLTTSSIPGYAMKAVDYNRARGAILGKAMQNLEMGKKGKILVLVSLQ